MVTVKSNISERNRKPRPVVISSRASKITHLSQARDKAILRQGANDGTIQVNKQVRTRTLQSQREPLAVIPLAQPKPIWLRSLMSLQTASSVITLLIVTASLAVYSGTIYGQAKWSEEYQKLEKLRRDEQQFSLANELLKHDIAELAVTPDVGLVPQDSIEPIFLSPAPLRPAPGDSNTASPNKAVEEKSVFEMPLAY